MNLFFIYVHNALGTKAAFHLFVRRISVFTMFMMVIPENGKFHLFVLGIALVIMFMVGRLENGNSLPW